MVILKGVKNKLVEALIDCLPEKIFFILLYSGLCKELGTHCVIEPLLNYLYYVSS